MSHRFAGRKLRNVVTLSRQHQHQQRRGLAVVAGGHEPGCPCCGSVSAAHRKERRHVIVENGAFAAQGPSSSCSPETMSVGVSRIAGAVVRGTRSSVHSGADLRRRWSSTAAASSMEYAFEVATSAVRFGVGATAEVGFDAKSMAGPGGRVAVFTDPHLMKLAKQDAKRIDGAPLGAVATTIRSLTDAGVDFEVYSNVRCEPTDTSFRDAIAWAMKGNFACYVAVGGGSVMDTAKAANLYATHPPSKGPNSINTYDDYLKCDYDFLAYVNPTIGEGRVVPGPLKPLIAIPTTAGTGSEATGVSIFDFAPLHAKTGIASRMIKPKLGIVDPLNTATMPSEVAAASGFDVLSHAIESYTAIPYNLRGPKPDRPELRPAYQGSNPISDVWALKSLEMAARNIVRAAEDPDASDARSEMILAATAAGVGFGSAGVHLPHGMSYPLAGNIKTLKTKYVHPGYPVDYPLVPHGVSVIMNAPAVFRYTALADPVRHVHVAKLLGGGPQTPEATAAAERDPVAAGQYVSDALLVIMRRLKVPDGLLALGYTANDVPVLVEGTLPQHRVTKLAPRPTGREELTKLFQEGLRLY